MLCPVSEEIENDYEQDVESELAPASAQFKEAVDDEAPPDLVDSILRVNVRVWSMS